jgi:hypothetical protein
MAAYTPYTGARCSCKRGVERDNCPTCEGSGKVIDFAAIHAARRDKEEAAARMARDLCACGSGLMREEHTDARGIFLCYACLSCEKQKLAGYRPDVLTNPSYWHDEPIDEDE